MKNIPELLYSLNKEAKRLRDESSQIWEEKEELKKELYENDECVGGGTPYAICVYSGIPMTREVYDTYWEDDEEDERDEYESQLDDSIEYWKEKHLRLKDLSNEIAQKNKKKEELYELKDGVLKVAKGRGLVSVIGYHVFKIGKGLLVEWDNFKFHSITDEDFDGVECLGDIDDNISSENKTNVKWKDEFYNILSNFVKLELQ